ncbi:MAG TPA: hypothetical protein VFQ23_01045, partial [Anaerolineales bacterium]|nr:hypothetical protein [Anaerolineales bacterium]
ERLVNAPPQVSSNPYLFMQPFGFGDGYRFFGRQETLPELLNHLNNSTTTFLDGSGKTSLLQAGVIPAVVNEGHLPLLISVSDEPLETSIKKQLLPNIGDMEFLDLMSLTEFVRRVSDHLKGKRLLLLIDQFENIYDQPQTFRNVFTEEWKLCVSGNAPDVHWLFSIPSGSTYLLNMFKEKVSINPNLVTLQPLEREEARQAMAEQANLRDIQIDADVADTILDDLDRLDNSVIDPAQLQLVCYMLAGGQSTLVKHWTMEHYIGQGRVDGILRGYLDRTIGNLEPVNREPAWQLLAALIDSSESVSNEAELIQKMKQFDVAEQITRDVLSYLEESHLVEYTTAYRLSSDSLRPSIQQWLDQRAAGEKVKAEVSRQVRNIGGSALRGLLGGAVGLMLSYWVLPYEERLPVTDPLFYSWYIYPLSLRAMVGAIAGFFLILLIDLIIASFRGTRNQLRLPAGILAGGSCFAAALLFHMLLHSTGNQFASLLQKIIIEGASWGVVAGAGAMWIMTSTRQIWLKVLTVSIFAGLTLSLSDSLLGGLDVSAPFYIVFISGMVLPLFLLGSALWGKTRI